MAEFPKTDDKKMEEFKIICGKLDELSIHILKTLQSILLERKYFNANLQEGYINMAKARYLMRGQKVGIQQVNSSNLKASLKVSNYLDVEEGVQYLNYKLDEDSVPQKDINLKTRNINAKNDSDDNQSSVSPTDDEDCETEGSETSKNSTSIKSSDPLKWFGVLVPESLRTCQARFNQSVLTALKIISLHNKLRELQKEYKALKLQKVALHPCVAQKDVLNYSSESKSLKLVKS